MNTLTRLDQRQLKRIPMGDGLWVKLSNVGNPDFRQDATRKLPDTGCGWMPAHDLDECSALCLAYISYFDLGGGNWNGGQILKDGKPIGRVHYNGVMDLCAS